MENRLEDYSFSRLGNSYVKGRGPRGGKIYGFREIYKTKVGDFSTEEWRKTVRQAIEDAGEKELLEEIKRHCRSHCAWLHREADIEEYSMKCLVERAYRHWKDFKGGLQMAEEKVEQAEVVENVPAKMEFRLINPTEKGFLKHIEWNKAELEAAVKAKVAEYSGVAYTEETLKLAKSDRAELNKLLKAIEERRKKVKEIINKPYADFEAELKEVTALIQEQMDEIDQQVSVFEKKQKEEKEKKIREAYEEAIGELAPVLPFEKVFDSRYLNKTYKLSTAQEEVKQKIQQVRTDLETIDSLDSKYKLNAKDVYIKTRNLSKALAENKRLTDLEEKLEAERIRKEKEAEERRQAAEKRKAEEEKRRAEAEARRQEEERKRAEAARIAKEQEDENQSVAKQVEIGSEQPESGSKLVKTEPEQAEIGMDGIDGGPITTMGRTIESIERSAFSSAVDPFAQKPEKKARVRFFAIGTKAQLKGLVEYMKENNIKYGKVE